MRSTKMKMMLTLGAAAMLALGACGGGGDDSAGDDDGTGPDAASSACNLVGTWNVPPRGGGSATYQVKADGTTLLTLGADGSLSGTWMLVGARLSLADTAATGVGAGQKCTAGVVGRYDIAFASSCNQVTMTLVSDACAMRAAVVDGLTVTR